MSRPEHLDPKSQQIHHNWTRDKRQKSQVNGQTEVTLHNKLLRTAAKSRQSQL
ncbi:YpzG family protein [Viridibacillus sp. NPDC096237]|uniref:YpzG family protein n=1 Tax=Viridibacillus sp. NPDC096237 TaxID=3390721 RepID=UPI003CFCA85B